MVPGIGLEPTSLHRGFYMNSGTGEGIRTPMAQRPSDFKSDESNQFLHPGSMLLDSVYQFHNPDITATNAIVLNWHV
jgi:hypothetical protein